jgi:general secretion pathway protein L
MESLFIQLPAQAGAPFRLASRSLDGSLHNLPDCADADALGALAAEHPHSRVVALAATCDCLLTSVTIGARQLKQAGNALAYLLEEQVGEDVENLHLVQGPQQANDFVPLLVVGDARMTEWLATLRGTGWALDALVPDLVLLPLATGFERSWSLGFMNGQVCMRTATYQGAALEAEAVGILLDAALLEAGGEEALTLLLTGAGEADLAAVESWAAGRRLLGQDVRLEQSEIAGTDLASLLAQQELSGWSRHPFNLLQGAYAERGTHGLSPAWRMAALFVLAAFLIQLSNDWLRYFYYHSRAQKTQAAAVQLYKQLFPDEHRIVNLRKQMDAHLQGNGGGSPMLQVLTQVAQGAQGAGLQTQRMQYDGENRVLNLDVDAQNLGQLESFKQKLESQGLSTELSSANAQGSGVRGRLKISTGAA